MIHLFLSALLWVWNQHSLDQISRNNIARKDAETAYQSGQFKRATERYAYLNQLGTAPDPALLLDLGHSYFQLSQYGYARLHYEKLRQIGTPEQIAVADVQLGVIACQEKDSATALALFQKAMLQNPDNEPARYNFELISRTFSGRTPTPQTGKQPRPKTASGRRSVATNDVKSTQVQTLVRSAQKNDRLNRFRNLNMTETQARQILDAMQGTDLPYLLSRHRTKPNETPPGNSW